MSLNIEDFKNYERISNKKIGGLILLRDNLSDFLNCSVKLIVNPIEYFENKFAINILENSNRSVYRFQDIVLLSCKIKENNNILAYLGVKLGGNLVSYYDNSLYEEIAYSVTRVLSDCYCEDKFLNSLFHFDKNFIKRLIINCSCKGDYQESTIKYLLDFIMELNTMTFENEHFDSGFILTRNVGDYLKKNIVKNRDVNYIELIEQFNLRHKERYNKRLWKLVNGNNSFILFNRTLEANHILIRNQENLSKVNFIDTISLSEFLYGKDIAFRTFGHNQFSIINSKGREIINIENRLRIRDYTILKKYLIEGLDFINNDEQFLNQYISKIIFIVNYCSINNRSSILWIPRDISICNNVLINNHNTVFKQSISLFEENLNELTLSCITSDGVSLISSNGELISFGNIVDISKAKLSGISGTGETAVKILATNGISIKVSSDGNVKIYSDRYTEPILL